MKLGKWLAIGALLLMARSKNTVIRGIGTAGGYLAAPRAIHMLRRRSG